MFYGHYINNEWHSKSGDRIQVFDPATEALIGEVAAGTTEDAEKAVAAASQAFVSWRSVGATERSILLHEIAGKIRQNRDELIRLLTTEEGKPIPESAEEIDWSADTFDYYAEIFKHSRGRVLAPNEASQFNFTLKEPYGVVGCIIPWNYPILLLAWKLAPALAAGNTVVIKPSELTSLTTARFVETCLDHLPSGVVNMVLGYGQPVGEALVNHSQVPLIAFTGSVATGQRIAQLAIPRLKKLHLELGGKDAFVVAPDAAIDASVQALMYSALINCGQVCTSTERVFIPESVSSIFIDTLVHEVQKLRLGPGIHPETDLGPMVGERYRAKFETHITDARDRGANILTGGQRPSAMPKGYFYEPTVLVDVDYDMLIMQQESFGPAIPIMTYKTLDEAIALANASDYGLGAVIRTNDPHTARRFFEEVKAGTIWINDPLTDNMAGPFGGMRLSGGARELGEEGLDQFREVKHVHWDMSDEPKPFWFPY
jgi:acyl-CoA reductase-like NAD-dependent aldehyde dehydrogenase